MIAELLYIIFSFFITVLIAYILGITIVNVVDKRLDKISIKLPEKWNVNSNQDDERGDRRGDRRNMNSRDYWRGDIDEEWNKQSNQMDKENEENYNNIMKVARQLKEKRINEDKLKSSISNNAVLIQNASGFNTTQHGGKKDGTDGTNGTKGTKETIEKFSNINGNKMDKMVDSKCSLDIGNNKIEPSQNNMYPSEPINYPHPQTMTRADLNVFSAKYHPRMTKQDYVNWLGLFKSKPNMEKLKKMGEIHYENLQTLLSQSNSNNGGCDGIGDFDICKVDTSIRPPPYVPTKLCNKGGSSYPHNACPFMSYDVKNIIGYNFGRYSEFS